MATATSVNLPNFSEFELQPRETAPTRFEKYIKRLKNMFEAMNITKDSQQKAMLLHYVGEETCDIVETLNIPEPTGEESAFEVCVKAISDYFEPQKCIDHHVYLFRQQTQKSGENITEFYTRLQLLARKCEFSDANVEIKRQIIQGTSSLRLRRKAIEQSLTLENLLKTARAIETANEQTYEIEKQHSNAITKSRKDWLSKKKGFRKLKSCGLCGGTYPHRGKCPAQGKACHKCGKLNHFSKVCRSKFDHPKPSTSKEHAKTLTSENRPKEVNDLGKFGSDNNEEYTFTTGEHIDYLIKPIFEVQIGSSSIRIMADSGATVNIISEQDFNCLKPKPQLRDTKTKVYPYMSEKPLDLSGRFEARVSSNSCSSDEVFYVARGSSNSILSWSTSQKLNLIKAVNVVDYPDHPSNAPDFIKDFPHLTSGMGCYRVEPVRIYVDESVKPVAAPHCRIPFHVRKQVEQKLESS